MADRDRPLAPRGRRAAERMAAVIAARAELSPDRILCSPTRRTRETLAPLSARIGDQSRPLILDELYEPAAGDYREVIATHGGSAHHLLVIGHNPAIQATALSLIGSTNDKTALKVAAKFPTAALAVIDFDARTWGEIRQKSGRLEAFIRPRDLEEADED
jgi:phosphohistidine phosphatase